MTNVTSFISTNPFCLNILSPDAINGNLDNYLSNITLIANHLSDNPISENIIIHTTSSWLYEYNFFPHLFPKPGKENYYETHKNLSQYKLSRSQVKQFHLSFHKLKIKTFPICNCLQEFAISISPPYT